MRDLFFTKTKFHKLTDALKHKICAELLRTLYESLLENQKNPNLWQVYHEYLSWMNLETLGEGRIKLIADRYHWHLSQAGILLKEHKLLPAIRRGDRATKEEFPPCAIYLDNLRSAYNVGSILRTTEALRVGSLYFFGNTPFIDNPKVQKTSMGASAIVPCFANADLKTLPRPIIAIETGEDALSVSSFPFPSQFTLIVGNEEYGISDAALKEVDHIVQIPLFGAKNSINVACAFAICAQEIRRQKELDEKHA